MSGLSISLPEGVLPPPLVRLEEQEPIEETSARIQQFFSAGGKQIVLEVYLSDLSVRSLAAEKAVRVFNYFLAARHIAINQELIKDIDENFDFFFDNQRLSQRQWSVLYEALKASAFNLAEKLYEKGVRGDELNPHTGESALQCFVREGNTLAVEWLLQKGISGAKRAFPKTLIATL